MKINQTGKELRLRAMIILTSLLVLVSGTSIGSLALGIKTGIIKNNVLAPLAYLWNTYEKNIYVSLMNAARESAREKQQATVSTSSATSTVNVHIENNTNGQEQGTNQQVQYQYVYPTQAPLPTFAPMPTFPPFPTVAPGAPGSKEWMDNFNAMSARNAQAQQQAQQAQVDFCNAHPDLCAAK